MTLEEILLKGRAPQKLRLRDRLPPIDWFVDLTFFFAALAMCVMCSVFAAVMVKEFFL